MKKIPEIIKNKVLRKTSFTILLIAVIITAYLAINLGIQAIDISDIDLTKEKFFSLSNESKNQLKDINQEIKIYMFGYEEDSSVVDLAKEYSKYKNNIKVEIVKSITERPDLAEKYNITTSDEEYKTVLFECEERNIKANYYDFFTMDYTTYEEIDLTEQKMTNSILGVTLENVPKIYFLTGHSEYSLDKYFGILSETLKSEINEVDTLDLLVKNEIPEDCKTLIIASPSTDFTDFETELIIKYVNNGGNILWLSDYSNSGTLSNTQKILDLYGINISNDGIILEQDSSAMLMQTQDLIIPKASNEAEITSAFAQSGKVLFIDSGKIEIKEQEKLDELGVTVTELLTTSEKSFYRTDLTRNSQKAEEGEEVKSYVLGALATKTIQKENVQEGEESSLNSKLVIFANNLFATDFPITIKEQAASAIYFYNNQDLILNSISYLTERKETITIRKTHSTVTYAPTETEDLVVKAVIFITPIIIITIGITIWILRKRRK